MKETRLALLAITLLSPLAAIAAQKPPLELASPFVDDMILQREMKVPVWGWAKPGSKITVAYAGQNKTATAVRLSDGTVNLTLLSFPTDADAGDERGCDFVGLHHIGVWVEDLGEAAEQVKQAGGTFQSMEGAEMPIEHAEHKYRDPFGVVIDVSTRGWNGARRDV